MIGKAYKLNHQENRQIKKPAHEIWAGFFALLNANLIVSALE